MTQIFLVMEELLHQYQTWKIFSMEDLLHRHHRLQMHL